MYRKVAAVLVAVLVAVLALGVASCGSSEPELTRAQLVKQTQAACRAARAVTYRKLRSNRSGDQVVFIAAVVAGQEIVVDRLNDLNPPAAAQDAFDAFKQGEQDRLDALKQIASSDRAEIERAIREAQPQIEAIGRRTSAAEKRLGIEGCT
jgi:hypothetical protein